MRWLCTACQVEWTASLDHGPCWNCETDENVRETFDVPTWLLGYRWRNRTEAS